MKNMRYVRQYTTFMKCDTVLPCYFLMKGTMQILPIFLTIIFSCFSTAIMSYIAMATPIGPWIAPTIALMALLVLKIIFYKRQSETLALITAGSSIGGIIATACAFSYPTLYFLNPTLFMGWMEQPTYFVLVMTMLVGTAGAFGIIGANFFEYSLLVEQQLSFPIGQLVYKMITAGNQVKKAIELLIGFMSTTIFCVLQDGIRGFIPAIIPRSCTLIPATSIGVFAVPHIMFDLWPMLWAIGFVTGHVIAIPLAVGALLKIGLVDPVHVTWFYTLSSMEFVLAFCSGMVLYGAITSFIALPTMLKSGIAWFTHQKFSVRHKIAAKNNMIFLATWIATIGSGLLFFRYFHFSLMSMVFIYITAFACMYQVAVIAGKFGLAPLGRFATFVMVPAMLFFQLNLVQIVLVATFVEVCCGVIADVLFGRKIGHLMKLDRRLVCFYQVIGLVVSSLVVGIVFWLLINHFQLGSPELFAYKAQNRQLLIHARQFDWYVLVIGAFCSSVLQYLKLNPMLVLGGILMPMNTSIGLIFGGLLTLGVKNREAWEPFWSGVFAANSIWMLLKAMVG